MYEKSPDFLRVLQNSSLRFHVAVLRFLLALISRDLSGQFLCHPIIDYNKQLEFSWGKRNRNNIFRIPGGNSSYISFMNKRSMKSMVFAHSWFIYELRF